MPGVALLAAILLLCPGSSMLGREKGCLHTVVLQKLMVTEHSQLSSSYTKSHCPGLLWQKGVKQKGGKVLFLICIRGSTNSVSGKLDLSLEKGRCVFGSWWKVVGSSLLLRALVNSFKWECAQMEKYELWPQRDGAKTWSSTAKLNRDPLKYSTVKEQWCVCWSCHWVLSMSKIAVIFWGCLQKDFLAFQCLRLQQLCSH